MEVNRIGVLGSGIMGHGIALVCARAGYDVVIRDVEDRFLQNGIEAIQKSLARLVSSRSDGIYRNNISSNVE